MLATSFAEAAGVSGRQKWGLVLSSSARVFQVTYQTVVGVRYPELVTFNGTRWKFGKYVPQERPQRGGFLPIFWDVPRANIHAVEDIGAVVDWLTERCEFHADAKSNLAVLHNRNDMTNLFRASNWVSSSHDSIVSRGVTTCAGMTAHTVLLAQTKVGFLTGGRKKSFLTLPEDEQMVQLEEAYARATVAITRARALCLIMGPLDMKGLLGAATVMGSAGHVWAGHAHFYLHDHELSRSPPDETFIDMLTQNCCLSGPHFPPPAIVEALQDYVTHYHKVRRLHLIVVDLWRPWKYNTARAREITDQLWRISHNDDTHRVSPFRPEGPEPPLRCRRFAYGYALDGSECPSYLVWLQRDGQSYTLLDTSTADTLALNHNFFRPLGMQHFYDSFALVSQICVRREALNLFGLREDELLPDLHITRDGVLRIGLGAHQEHRVNHVARATDRTKVSAQVIQLAAHEWSPSLRRLSRTLVPVTLKEVRVRVTLSRMIFLLRWWLMQNSMSSCKFRMLQWARTSTAKRRVGVQQTPEIGDGSREMASGEAFFFLYKLVWTTLTGYWPDVAGKFRLHVLPLQNHFSPFTKWRSV